MGRGCGLGSIGLCLLVVSSAADAAPRQADPAAAVQEARGAAARELYEHAEWCAEHGLLGRRMRSLERVLELEPDHAEAHFHLGDLAQRERRTDDAIVRFDLVVRLEPGYPEARRRLAALLTERGGPEDAERAAALLRREATDLLKGTPDPDALRDLATLLLDAGLVAEAVEAAERLSEATPEAAESRQLLSVALLHAGQRARGLGEARRALRLDPRCVPAMHNLALACLQDRRYRHARYWLREARRVAPDDHSLRRLRLSYLFSRLAAVVLSLR